MADTTDNGALQLDQPDTPLQLDPQQQPRPYENPNIPRYISNPQATPQPEQQPPYTGTIPSETMPRNPDMERDFHESKWRNILDKVGSILGGGETVHLTKDSDGNITEVHMPSTTSEKWGRV